MNDHNIIIVGGGAAGMTAAVYAANAGMKAIVIEGEFVGGQIVNAPKVTNFPGFDEISGYEIGERLRSQAEKSGAEIISDRVSEVSVTDGGFSVKCRRSEYAADAVILALGTRPRKLGLPEEEKFSGKGISFCAYCDGGFYRGKTVVVAGGGNTALYDAAYLSKVCGKVLLVHRRDEFRGDMTAVERLKASENVEIFTSKTIKQIIGSDRVEGVLLSDANGGEDMKLSADGIFIAMGRIPGTGDIILPDALDTDENGYIKCGEDCLTSVPGLFAAGDCRTKSLRQLVTAAADGAYAGANAAAYCRQK